MIQCTTVQSPQMGSNSLLFLTLIVILSKTTQAQGIISSRLLDLIIRDFTLKSYNNYIRTGAVKSVNLPSNFTGVNVNTAKFRCGSLRRYGAKINEFRLGIGIIIHPCVERVLIITQNLGLNWSRIYYENYNLVGYKLVSPVLGMLVYNAGDNFDYNLSNPFELNLVARKESITIDFSNVTMYDKSSGLIPLCATFRHDGRVLLTHQVAPNVCSTTGPGHFGIVMESPEIPEKKTGMKRWKVAIGTIAGAGLGLFLLSLLIIALFVRVKRRSKIEEMVRRGYDEEALRVVTMVGHVRAHVAHSTRTNPAIEHGYM